LYYKNIKGDISKLKMFYTFIYPLSFILSNLKTNLDLVTIPNDSTLSWIPCKPVQSKYFIDFEFD